MENTKIALKKWTLLGSQKIARVSQDYRNTPPFRLA